MTKKILLLLNLMVAFLICGTAVAGSYAPAAGKDGSTAIYMTDESIIAWATGYQDYIVGDRVSSSWQTPEKALGEAVGSSYDIVCLGAGGSITLTFDTVIADGDGYDFAVFENSFNDTFLELAYVEVSSDGINWYRFYNDSQTSGSVGGFGAVDPTNITGLAGKYKQGYGTPFDLSSLYDVYTTEELQYLDFNSISYVKIIDIIGDGTYLDSDGDVIYDPYQTSGSAGFDLDAIAVLNTASAVPVPSAVFLLAGGLIGLAGLRRKQA